MYIIYISQEFLNVRCILRFNHSAPRLREYATSILFIRQVNVLHISVIVWITHTQLAWLLNLCSPIAVLIANDLFRILYGHYKKKHLILRWEISILLI